MISKELADFVRRQMTPENVKRRIEEEEKKHPSLDSKISSIDITKRPH
jgi:hypothetical protein